MLWLLKEETESTNEAENIQGSRSLTLMCWVYNQFAHHCLYDADIAIEHASEESAKEGDPEVGCESNDEERYQGAGTA